jgi:hypothetical protein
MSSAPALPKIPTNMKGFRKSAWVTPLTSIVFARGPPFTEIPWITEHAAAPLPGSAPLTLTLPPTHVIAIASPALLVTDKNPLETLEVTAADAGGARITSTAMARKPRSERRLP